jgi:hypothetical protein
VSITVVMLGWPVVPVAPVGWAVPVVPRVWVVPARPLGPSELLVRVVPAVSAVPVELLELV